MANPILTYDATIISPGIDLTISGTGTPNITATYHDRTSAGGTPPLTNMAECSVNISYDNVSWTLNNDGSVTVTGNVSNATLTRVSMWTGDVGYSQDIWTRFNEQQTFSTTVVVNAGGTWGLNIPSSFSITVPPRTTATTASIHYFNKSHGYAYEPDEFTVGLIVENPNYPDYRPGERRDADTWKSHNRSGGKAEILVGGTWTEMRTQQGTGNPPLIRESGVWRNQSKIGAE